MKVALIATPIMDFAAGVHGGPLHPTAMDYLRVCPPYGVYLLAGSLRAAGHEPVVVDLIAQGTHRLDLHADRLEECGLIGVAATSLAWSTARLVIEELKDLVPETPVVIGGVHGTQFDEAVLVRSSADFVIRGEAEVALVELCSALERGGDVSAVPALTWRGADGTFVRNPAGPKISKVELGSAPLPEYGQLPAGVFHNVSIESSRGCAFDCSFCSTSYRKSWRGIPPELFVDRLERILPFRERSTAGNVQVVDDEFCLNPKRALEIMDLIAARGLSFRMVYDARANDLVKGRLLEALEPYTQTLLIGAECGYDEGLARIGKKVTCASLEAAAAALAAHGMASRAQFSFIFGLPWETRVEVEKTLTFAVRLHETYGIRALLQWYVLIPGSHLWAEARDRQVVSAALYDQFGWLRDLYGFRAAVSLLPSDVWEIARQVRVAQERTRARLGESPASWLQHSIPQSVVEGFPRELLPARPAAARDGRPLPVAAGLPRDVRAPNHSPPA